MLPRVAIFVVACICAPRASDAQEIVADTTFDTRVVRPAYASSGPRILFDEAHNNYHTSSGRYRPFAELLTNDGYRITANRLVLSREELAAFDILIIANARGVPPRLHGLAFSDAEVAAVVAWVQSGGALLFIADHHPDGSAGRGLARGLGVDFRGGWLSDTTISVKDSQGGKYPANPGILVFSRANELLADHPITAGRNESERVNRIMSFTGQSLLGPPGSSILFKPTTNARDNVPVDPDNAPARREVMSAAGRVQGLAFTLGRGRVVVLGEAGMLSAQLVPGGRKFGMNVPGIDNRQFALNVMHWLSGLLPNSP